MGYFFYLLYLYVFNLILILYVLKYIDFLISFEILYVDVVVLRVKSKLRIIIL